PRPSRVSPRPASPAPTGRSAPPRRRPRPASARTPRPAARSPAPRRRGPAVPPRAPPAAPHLLATRRSSASPAFHTPALCEDFPGAAGDSALPAVPLRQPGVPGAGFGAPYTGGKGERDTSQAVPV